MSTKLSTVDRIRGLFGYVQRGELWDGAPAYWHRGQAYRRLHSGQYLHGLTPEESQQVHEMAKAYKRIH